jgi:hypothetical protein
MNLLVINNKNNDLYRFDIHIWPAGKAIGYVLHEQSLSHQIFSFE